MPAQTRRRQLSLSDLLNLLLWAGIFAAICTWYAESMAASDQETHLRSNISHAQQQAENLRQQIELDKRIISSW